MAANNFSTVTADIKNAASYIKDMAEAVKDIDDAITELYKVTDETDKRYEQFFTNTCKNAKELGRSISCLVTHAAEWSKLGFSLDQAEKLAKISAIYAGISGADDVSAISGLAAAMKAFNIEAENSITIVDSLNKLGKEFSAGSSDLGEGLKNSAASMSAAGADMNETLAMLTGGSEITKSAEEFGDFLNIAGMRIRGMKDELEALGEEVEPFAGSIDEIQTRILRLTGGRINIFDSSSNLRDYYDIMKDIADVYSGLSSANQDSLDGILFGKQNSAYGSALIQAFKSGQVQKALDASLNSSGSAMKEQELQLESLEGKTSQLQAAFQSLCSKVIDSDLLKFFTDLGTAGVNALDGLADVLGKIDSFFSGGETSLLGGLGAVSGLLMNRAGIGERTVFRW